MFPNAIEATVEFILLLIRFIILIRLKFFAMQMFIVGGLQRRPPFKAGLKYRQSALQKKRNCQLLISLARDTVHSEDRKQVHI